MAGIKDVAKRCGVSISTVSNVINGSRYVSEELCEKVHQAIKELDYEVDLLARSLKNNKTMTIGVLLTSMDRIFIPQVLSGMQQSAEAHKYTC
ncbi:MAG: LacI family DNA-binding transcriptional regulator [Hungatella sp.]